MSETDPYTVLHKMVDTAYRLGQIYWQQADSEYASQHKKADETNKKFLALRVEAANAVNELERECSELRAKLAECERQEPVAVCVAVNEWTTEPRYVYPADDKNPPAGTKLYANPLALREPSYEECELICSAYNSQSGITHMGARMFNAVREVMT